MNIVIVGAGRGGSALIESLSKLDDVHISMVIDANSNAPGLGLARSLGIASSNSMDSIANLSVDTIIEATGSEAVAQSLYEKFSHKCTIIDSHGALLLMSLVRRDITTLQKLNSQLDAINTTTTIVQNQLSEISTSIDTLQDVSDSLISSTKISTQHIQESDKIIQYVNNIAKQIKILGINATIEAARAGEHGRGFSVVANEIQNLANNSAKFANEINSILLQLSNEINNINKTVGRLDSLSQVQVKVSENFSNAVSRLVDEANK